MSEMRNLIVEISDQYHVPLARYPYLGFMNGNRDDDYVVEQSAVATEAYRYGLGNIHVPIHTMAAPGPDFYVNMRVVDSFIPLPHERVAMEAAALAGSILDDDSISPEEALRTLGGLSENLDIMIEELFARCGRPKC